MVKWLTKEVGLLSYSKEPWLRAMLQFSGGSTPFDLNAFEALVIVF